MASQLLRNNYRNALNFTFESHQNHPIRSIFTTSHLDGSWTDKIKSVFTGQKTSPDLSQVSSQNFTLLRYAEEMSTARKAGSFKQFIVGRSSEATFADAFEKQEAIIRHLGGFDNTGDNILSSHKQDAAKHCKCTIMDVENALAKFTWAKEAQQKMVKLKEEGKPMPKNLNEIQKLMGSTPLDIARSNLAQSGQISRNAFCPCGSKKRYKRFASHACSYILSCSNLVFLFAMQDVKYIALVLWERLKKCLLGFKRLQILMMIMKDSVFIESCGVLSVVETVDIKGLDVVNNS
ncbi:hypothetical protein GIB67_034542 [Kingdonia uniflora]|uniref:Uncharacterized protein n=1 Tax=Kingdonia uniflora TaxID=39325 RepID=A0A7J7PBH1_9MAGN|nr:hypothetical protein GIB67_034542 [Kingdonia uniflora]